MTVDTSRYEHRDEGHDGSHYQPDAGPMDLAAVHAIPMDWLGWKTTQSDKGVDRSFAGVEAAAEQIGFRWFLPYGWLSSTTDPHAQADNYLAHCGKIRAGKGAMIDAEEKGITVAKVIAKAERIEEEFKRPSSIYTGLYVAGGTIWRSEEVRNSQYGPRPMHLAAYVSRANLLQRLTELGLLELAMHMWQWSSNGILTTGQHIPGITGRADLNTVVTPSMMDLACGLTGAPIPTPVPIPVPTPLEEIVNYYVVTGASARFIGTPAAVQWTGPGDAKVQAAIDTQLAAGNLTLVNLTGGPMAFGATFLTGPLPTGDSYQWTGDEFANAAAIKSGHGADPAMAAVAALQSTVKSLDTEVGRIRDWAHSGTNT